ncbi:MAG TPA: hypothetical protein VK152_03530 [Paludibacter sp.]|nr:hypothetical protein [Paludibacter sp.]
MKKHILLPIIACLLLATSCTEETLDQSVFVPDVNNPGLPAYSEWGYNTFGAYIDRSVFVSNNQDLPAKIIVSADTFNLRLAGEWRGNPTTLKISIKGYVPNDYTGLVSLNDSTVNLASDACVVTLYENNVPLRLNVFEGQIHFKRVQKLFVDKEMTETILSGTFNFKTFYHNEPIAISKGRFDLGIGYDNFYKL